MILSSESPTFTEWIAILHDSAERAERLAASLTTQLRDFPFMVGPQVHLSLEEFVKAKQWLTEAIGDPAKQSQIEQQIALGHATMMPPPDRFQWQALIDTDAKQAGKLCAAFQLKCAMLGISTPQAIRESLAIYNDIFRKNA